MSSASVTRLVRSKVAMTPKSMALLTRNRGPRWRGRPRCDEMSGDASLRAVPGMSARGSRSGRPPASPAPAPAPGDLLELPLRANPAFRLVLFDRLPAGQRRQLAGLARDPEHYGVLRPRRGTGLGLKAVDRETALLFLTLARPGPLPGYVRSRLGDDGAALVLARLVADGVLEIERAPGGFVSSAAATPLFAAPAAGGAAPWPGAGADAARARAAPALAAPLRLQPAAGDAALAADAARSRGGAPLSRHRRGRALAAVARAVLARAGAFRRRAMAEMAALAACGPRRAVPGGRDGPGGRGAGRPDLQALRQPGSRSPAGGLRRGPRRPGGSGRHRLQGGRRGGRPVASRQDRRLLRDLRASGGGGRRADRAPGRGRRPGSPFHLGDRRRRPALLGSRSAARRGVRTARGGRQDKLAPLADESPGTGVDRRGGRRIAGAAVAGCGSR